MKVERMKVEVWSDVICPWCGLGQHRLEQALASFAHRADVEVVHRSFQLDPTTPATPRPVRQMLAEKYGMNEAQLQATFARIEGLAAADSLTPYVVGDNVVGNTGLAHELLALAATHGLEDAAWQRVYRAYFGERRSIFDLESLVVLGAEIGLEPEEVRTALAERRFRAQVEADGRAAQALGSTGVPFVVIDGRYAIAGAQPTATFLRALEQAWREKPTPLRGAADAGTCGPEGCEVPERS